MSEFTKKFIILIYKEVNRRSGHEQGDNQRARHIENIAELELPSHIERTTLVKLLGFPFWGKFVYPHTYIVYRYLSFFKRASTMSV